MGNDRIDNGVMRFRLWLKQWWLWIFTLLLAGNAIHLWFSRVPFYTVDYWLASISKGHIVWKFGSVIITLALLLLGFIWFAAQIRRPIRFGVTLLAAVSMLSACVTSFIGGAHGDFLTPEYYIDSAQLEDRLYHLTVTPGISSERPAYYVYQCDARGLDCERIADIPTHLMCILEKQRCYPVRQAVLVANMDANLLYVRDDTGVLYEYRP